jgi:pimeloyl-ACP methyl ester carboxylesterase
VDRYYDLGRRAGNRQAIVDRLTHLSDPDLDTRLGEIHVPVLVEWGERDAWLPPAFARRLSSEIAGAGLVTYPGAGHVPMEELPEATVADAERFLAAGSANE